MKFSIFERKDERSIKISEEIKEKLKSSSLVFDDENPDIVCVVGGDGTFLAAIHKYMDIVDSVKFSGIHTGTLGFLNEFSGDDIDEYVNAIVNKTPKVIKTNVLMCETNGRVVKAINEFRIESLQSIKAKISINGEFLENYRGSGLAICTQTGSTGYNRSIHGAIIQPGLNLMQLCEVAGVRNDCFSSLGNPLILNGDTTITIELLGDNNASLCFDGFIEKLPGNQTLKITLSKSELMIAHYKNTDWLGQLNKLF